MLSNEVNRVCAVSEWADQIFSEVEGIKQDSSVDNEEMYALMSFYKYFLSVTSAYNFSNNNIVWAQILLASLWCFCIWNNKHFSCYIDIFTDALLKCKIYIYSCVIFMLYLRVNTKSHVAISLHNQITELFKVTGTDSVQWLWMTLVDYFICTPELSHSLMNCASKVSYYMGATGTVGSVA